MTDRQPGVEHLPRDRPDAFKVSLWTARPPPANVARFGAPPSAPYLSTAPQKGTSPKVLRSISVRVFKPTDTMPTDCSKSKVPFRGATALRRLQCPVTEQRPGSSLRPMSSPAKDHARPFSPDSLADRWLVSAETVRQLCHQGRLRHFRIGRKFRIPHDAVIEFETGQAEGWTVEAKSRDAVEEWVAKN